MNGLGVIYVAGSRRDPGRDEANGSGFDMTAQRQIGRVRTKLVRSDGGPYGQQALK